MALFESKIQRKADRSHQEDEAFSRAVQKGFMEEMTGFLMQKSKKLLPFDKVSEELEVYFVQDLGIQSVDLDSIIGSVGRFQSFTRHFFPLEESLRDRWKSISAARYSKKDLPPVSLYKVGNAFFVKDGHHRISVSRANGNRYIDAHVFEYECSVPIDQDTDLDKLAIQETYHKFLKETLLRKNRPGADLQLTLLGGYAILMEHIQAHQYYLNEKEKRDVGIEEAACSWYDKVYLPIAAILKNHHIMKRFPHRTETDFYIWVIHYRRPLIKEYIEKEDAQGMVEDYARKYDSALRPFIGAIRRFLGLVKYR
jgi:hypothetical protein